MFIERTSEILLWASVAALLYTYVLYPVLVFALSRLRPLAVRSQEHLLPSVSVIITAYNEERDLAAKLENTLALDYPTELMEIIVASDCSIDRTDEIVKEFARRTNGLVRLYRQAERAGKTSAQNAAVEIAQNEIILFSDATTLYRADVLRRIVPNFADESIGCVAGKLIYVDPSRSSVGQGARSYWGYETFLKKHESRVCSLIGVSGCLYAVRRQAYVPMYPEACSDFLIATKMIEQGLRTIYEPAAVCTEETNRQANKEMQMRVRVIAQTYTDLWRHRRLLNPFTVGFYAVQLLSHKVMRYLVPIFLITLFVASAVLAVNLITADAPAATAPAASTTFFAASPRAVFYLLLFGTQTCFYLAALAGWLLERAGVRHKLLALPHYFVLANLAALIAFYKFLRGERFARWEPIRGADVAIASAPARVGGEEHG